MTALLERPVAPVGPPAARRAGAAATAALPWVTVAAALVVALRLTGTPIADIVGYAAYWALAVVLPGTLVHRALRGSRGNLPEDLGYGAAVGLLLELLAWASAAAVGAQPVLRFWPVPVVLAFAAVPRLRGHWRIARPDPMPARWAWASAITLLLVVGWAAISWRGLPLPPVTAAYYQDLLYHLALVQELTRTMPFEVPQLAGDTLRYHYLSDAHMAAASMITGVSPATVLLRLWAVPVAATAVLVLAGLARELTGRWWAGAMAGAVAFVGAPLMLGAPVTASGGGALSYLSPSQTYAMPLLILLAVCAVDVLRGRHLGAGWVLVPLLALACAGAKSSALPPLAAGVLLAGVVLWWRERRAPWPVIGLFAAVVAAAALGYRIFAGGGAGTLDVQPLSALRWMPPYSRTLGTDDGIDRGGLLPDGVAGASATGWLFLAAVVLWWLLMQAPRLAGLGALGARRMRNDPVVWLLGGTILAATGAAWFFYHPSASQFYFFACGVPFGAVLSVWLLAEHVRRRWVPAAAFALGVLWVALAPEVPRPAHDTLRGWGSALYLPLLWTALAAAVVVVVPAVALRRRVGTPAAGSLRSAVLVAVTAAVLGGSVGAGAGRTVKSLSGPPPTTPAPERAVTADEMRAALWLDAHAADDDVVATNVHCHPVVRVKPCDARAFWVAGLGGHRTVVESWGYSDETIAAHGVDGLRYYEQPAPDPALFARNERVFTDASAADLAELRRSYGVRWLFADLRAGPASPRLAGLATVRFVSGPVTVYEVL